MKTKIIILLLITSLTALVQSCGRKGPLTSPNGEKQEQEDTREIYN